MAEIVLKNNYFQFNSNVKHQISGTAIGTKFAPQYACIYMGYMEHQFLKNEQFQIHKRLVSVPGRPVTSNCGTAIQKASEFLDHHLQS